MNPLVTQQRRPGRRRAGTAVPRGTRSGSEPRRRGAEAPRRSFRPEARGARPASAPRRAAANPGGWSGGSRAGRALPARGPEPRGLRRPCAHLSTQDIAWANGACPLPPCDILIKSAVGCPVLRAARAITYSRSRFSTSAHPPVGELWLRLLPIRSPAVSGVMHPSHNPPCRVRGVPCTLLHPLTRHPRKSRCEARPPSGPAVGLT